MGKENENENCSAGGGGTWILKKIRGILSEKARALTLDLAGEMGTVGHELLGNASQIDAGSSQGCTLDDCNLCSVRRSNPRGPHPAAAKHWIQKQKGYRQSQAHPRCIHSAISSPLPVAGREKVCCVSKGA